ncbi:hypothetical protein G9A89_021717 [Geosiphon pyriformis]|nr:hypothetical protein G9A89_021717 [Geosiphon pyriformis]
MKTRTQLTDIDKGKILALIKIMSAEKVAKEIKRDPTTIRRFLAKYKRTKKIENLPRSGRPHILKDKQKNALIQKAIKERSKPLRDIVKDLDLKCSLTTARMVLHDAGIRSHIAAKKSSGFPFEQKLECCEFVSNVPNMEWTPLPEDRLEINPAESVLHIYNTMNNEYQDDRLIVKEVKKWLAWNNYSPNQLFSIVTNRAQELSSQYASLYAFLHCYGIGTVEDKEQTFIWYKTAAENGDIAAQSQLGWCCYTGVGTQSDHDQAFYWFQKSALNGCATAEGWVGACYEHGHGTLKNRENAFVWYTHSANDGDGWGMYKLGYCYARAIGTPQDKLLAEHWFRRSAEAANRTGQRMLASFLLDKEDKNDHEEALIWLQKSAEQGELTSQKMLGDYYMETEDKRAVYWYRKASDEGSQYAPSNLGSCHQYGFTGLKKDIHEAIRCYRIAVKRRDSNSHCEFKEM